MNGTGDTPEAKASRKGVVLFWHVDYVGRLRFVPSISGEVAKKRRGRDVLSVGGEWEEVAVWSLGG